jgi:hypothetical protein
MKVLSRFRSAGIFVFLLAIAFTAERAETAWAQNSPPAKLRERVRTLELDASDTRGLAYLFRNGDKYVKELGALLHDEDPSVRANAQRVIRYLASPPGMSAIFSAYSKRNEINIVGPIPSPLSEWDYDYIETTFVDKPGSFGELSRRYMYALFLDPSPRARELLNRMVETAKRGGTDSFDIRAVTGKKPVEVWFRDDDAAGLVSAVLRNSFFLPDGSKRTAKAKLISFDATNSKALIEVDVSSGDFVGEVYHVVVLRKPAGWTFVWANKVLET